MRRYLAAASMVLAVLGSAHAQELDDGMRPGLDGMSTIQSSLTMMVPVGSDEDPLARQQAATKSFYRMAGSACTQVLDTIADSCEIRNVTSDIRINDRDMRGLQMTLTGRITMKVRFKPAPAASTPQ
jgi:hypothetical protein